MEYSVININDWKKLDKFTIKGRTVKNLFLSPDEKIYLFKISENSRGCLNDIRGSHWAEKICSEIGRILNKIKKFLDINKIAGYSKFKSDFGFMMLFD